MTTKQQADRLKVFHLWMTMIWAVLIPITVLFLRESILWIALMSVWANFVGHFSAYQAGRSEQANEE